MQINEIPEAFSLPLRLKLISSLVGGTKSFQELKNLTQATDGNISVQLTKLENWGYVKSNKTIRSKKMHTTYCLTDFGLEQLKEYVELLNQFLKPGT